MSFYQNLDIYLIISCFCLFIIFEFCFLTSDARTMQYLCLSSARICGRWKYSSRPAILALKMQITFLQFWMQEKSLSHMKGFNMCYLKNLVRVFFIIIQWFDTALMAMVLLFCVCKMFCSNSIVGRVLSVSISGVRVRLLSALITFHLKYFSTKIVNCQGEAAEIAKLEWFGPWYYFWILAMSFV